MRLIAARSISTLSLLRGQQKTQNRGPSVKYWKTALSIFALSASLALAEDFKTIKGKEYKNASVSRVEPDGIVVVTKSGISKVYFIELPKEVQKRFGYDTDKIAKAAARAAEEKRILEQRAALLLLFLIVIIPLLLLFLKRRKTP